MQAVRLANAQEEETLHGGHETGEAGAPYCGGPMLKHVLPSMSSFDNDGFSCGTGTATHRDRRSNIGSRQQCNNVRHMQRLARVSTSK
ncbi:hypothetical protein PUNSTDRAFT_118980 [Punctularia strigosozonata HHB-11173 SS5]|uniref:uncharacterized protein n=1 Tax=Punctularia strigosozonata (strain HHB-11173) TaxID=741275 RepID=UPI0004416E4A|nr:uncharacterized protein PUNSTDRAFT_118980 [Punctularia strigosozonata HHB-11173 SS5]EIN11703.1 hypothetical protein PUNSTDRAFT_118980 [Punctularia strigosozonata HHB-11173 SS5]